jgi:hypothetical protein
MWSVNFRVWVPEGWGSTPVNDWHETFEIEADTSLSAIAEAYDRASEMLGENCSEWPVEVMVSCHKAAK